MGVLFLITAAPDDYTSTSGSFDITDSNTIQCIPISIVSDSVTETNEECFTFTLSTTSTAAGLTLSPTSATICISGEGGLMLQCKMNFLYTCCLLHHQTPPHLTHSPLDYSSLTTPLWKGVVQ